MSTEQQNGTTRVAIVAACALGTALLLWVLLPPVRSERETVRYAQCRYHLKQIGLALRQYHDDYGSFPAAYTVDDDGRPMHSWRALILPYLEQAAPLYNSYHFDEPWDGPANAELRTKGVFVLQCPSSQRQRKTLTNYLAVVGPNSAWPGTRGAKIGEDFPKGLSNTILLVEVNDSDIDWIEPRDLNFDEMSFELNGSSGKSISAGHSKEGWWPWSGPLKFVNVLFADGVVKQLPLDTPPETIRAWLTARGGDLVERGP